VKDAQKSATSGTAKSARFTDDERAAMKERARELKADARPGSRRGKADEETLLEKNGEIPPSQGE
jgi:hypothetical protein